MTDPQHKGGWTPGDLRDLEHGSAFAEAVWVAVEHHSPREMTKMERSEMSDAVTNAAVEFVMAWNRARIKRTGAKRMEASPDKSGGA